MRIVEIAAADGPRLHRELEWSGLSRRHLEGKTRWGVGGSNLRVVSGVLPGQSSAYIKPPRIPDTINRTTPLRGLRRDYFKSGRLGINVLTRQYC